MIKHLQLIRRIGSDFSYFKIAFLLVAFCISASARLQAQTWPVIGGETQIASEASNYTSITVVETPVGEDGYETVPYIAFTEASIAKVKRFIKVLGKVWVETCLTGMRAIPIFFLMTTAKFT